MRNCSCGAPAIVHREYSNGSCADYCAKHVPDKAEPEANKQRTFDSLPWCNSPDPCQSAIWQELDSCRPKCSVPVNGSPCRYHDTPILTEEQVAAGLYIHPDPAGVIALMHTEGHVGHCIAAHEASHVDLIKAAAEKWMDQYGLVLDLTSAKLTATRVKYRVHPQPVVPASLCVSCPRWPSHCTGIKFGGKGK